MHWDQTATAAAKQRSFAPLLSFLPATGPHSVPQTVDTESINAEFSPFLPFSLSASLTLSICLYYCQFGWLCRHCTDAAAATALDGFAVRAFFLLFFSCSTVPTEPTALALALAVLTLTPYQKKRSANWKRASLWAPPLIATVGWSAANVLCHSLAFHFPFAGAQLAYWFASWHSSSSNSSTQTKKSLWIVFSWIA